ncbi:hypothetical protein LTR37_013386 [Vermiconidia calcicola]|uniref:Uncharacterized protein n=1 Tax=Vermiconidia calcicola TaxID=1690605 RepID=A0ACC3MWL5_9PEZI|nr:hypothetical protein LTR37_013386 [Vermiconidia calcicola]
MSPSAVYPEDEYNIVETSLNHWLDPAKGGHDHYITGTAGYYRRKFDAHPIKIKDFRGREDEFNINTQGFGYLVSPTVGGDFRDSEKVKKEVYPETEQLLKDVTGATRVKVFSHILRNDSRDKAEKAVLDNPDVADDAPMEDVVPARFVHIDQSARGAEEVLEDNIHPPELAEKLKKTRYSIINVWRPIKKVFKDPLAMCDWRTVNEEEDLKPIMVYLPPKDTGFRYSTVSEGEKFELVYTKHNPNHEWYYRSGMQPGECLLIKCFDTISDGKTARKVPHSAFTDPNGTDEKR